MEKKRLNPISFELNSDLNGHRIEQYKKVLKSKENMTAYLDGAVRCRNSRSCDDERSMSGLRFVNLQNCYSFQNSQTLNSNETACLRVVN